MILPSKHIVLDYSLIGVGATLLVAMKRRDTVTALWEDVRTDRAVGTFERFVLAMTLLFVLGAVEYVDGRVVRVEP